MRPHIVCQIRSPLRWKSDSRPFKWNFGATRKRPLSTLAGQAARQMTKLIIQTRAAIDAISSCGIHNFTGPIGSCRRQSRSIPAPASQDRFGSASNAPRQAWGAYRYGRPRIERTHGTHTVSATSFRVSKPMTTVAQTLVLVYYRFKAQYGMNGTAVPH